MEMTNFWIFAIIYEAFPAEKNPILVIFILESSQIII